jgi:transcriptional regulator with XRE-family HTH domain
MLRATAPSLNKETPMPKAVSKAVVPRRRSRARATPAQPAEPALPALQKAGGAAVRSLARQLHSWTGSLIGGVGTAADMSLALAAASVQRPGPKAAVAKAAALVRDAREAAGLTLDDLGAALDLKDPTFMALVESGKVGLPFEMILRLATILGRNDPITFILQLTRSYNPRVWKSLEALGIGKLLVQAGREREFANIYRSNTAARQLSDRDFAAALAFSAAAFDSALVFLGHAKKVESAKAETATPKR